MSIYYVGSLSYSDELTHHGILGQKWGVRRYQNPDGSLTPEGKERYGSLGEHGKKNHNIFRRVVTGDYPLGTKRIGEYLERGYEKGMRRQKEKGNKESAKNYEKLYKAQKKANIDYDRYTSSQSTGKLFLQAFLLGGLGARQYALAMKNNETFANSVAKSVIPEIAMNIPYVGLGAEIGSDLYFNKKRYGKATW